MALALKLALSGDLGTYYAAQYRGLELGAMLAAAEAATELKARLRSDVVAGGLGQRTAQTWRSNTYPSRGESLNASAIVFSKAAHIVDAFTQGTTIRSNDGFWLAIPTDEVPEHWRRGARNRPRITPGQLEERLGIRLRLVPVRADLGLLVADKVRRKRGKRGGFASPSASALARGDHESIAFFFLVPQATLRKRLHVAEIEEQFGREWPGIIERNTQLMIENVDRQFGT